MQITTWISLKAYILFKVPSSLLTEISVQYKRGINEVKTRQQSKIIMAKSKKSPKAATLQLVFDLLRKNQNLWVCWRTTEQWINVINTLYPEAKPFDFTKTDLSTMLTRDPVYKHCLIQFGFQRNEHGVYIDTFKTGNVRNTAIYYCVPNTTVRKPPCNTKWWEEIAQRVPLLRGFDREHD